ncbi:TPA: hypothetical protein ACFRHE_002102 [Neisseria lactamica]
MPSEAWKSGFRRHFHSHGPGAVTAQPPAMSVSACRMCSLCKAGFKASVPALETDAGT